MRANPLTIIATLALFSIDATLVLAASKPQPSLQAPVWPPAPDEPRITYVGSLHDPLDIGQTPSFFKRVGRLFTGTTGDNVALQKPFGLAVDQEGNLCISDTGAKR